MIAKLQIRLFRLQIQIFYFRVCFTDARVVGSNSAVDDSCSEAHGGDASTATGRRDLARVRL